jgi:GNAT superfamily N-acetyltransferase
MELRVATEAEKIERDTVTFAEWGTRLSLEQYLEREKVLRAHAFSKGMTTWLWCDGPTVLCSCETYENHSRINGEFGTTWSFASVFTEPHLRGKGHATRMMNRLVLSLEGRLRAQASILFSDVGARLYERSGFIAVPGKDLVLPPLHGDPAEGVTPMETITPLHRGTRGVLEVTPSPVQLDWAVAREAFYANILGQQRPSFRAAATEHALAFWAGYYKSSELIVLWLEGKDVEPVLRAAQRQAYRCGLERVRMWWPEGQTVPPGGTLIERDGELPMYRPYVPVTGWLHVQRALWV